MRQTLTILAMAVAASVAGPAAAVAQPNATIILASGDRISGQLVDLNASGFQMTVNGQMRDFPRGEVAVIDFVTGGSDIPAAETARMQGGRTLVFLRGGDYFYGTLYDLSQRDPLLITVQTPDGERQVMSNQVGRIYLRAWNGMPDDDDAQAGGNAGETPSATARTIALPANQAWMTTGVRVQQGQLVAFDAAGEIRLGGTSNDRARSGGAMTGRIGGRGAPLPADPAGALVGRIGNQTFGIGNQTHPLPMPASGVLLLGVNDGTPGDNTGSYTVTIDLAPTPAPVGGAAAPVRGAGGRGSAR